MADKKVTFLIGERLIEKFDEKVKATGLNRTEALEQLVKSVITGSISVKIVTDGQAVAQFNG